MSVIPWYPKGLDAIGIEVFTFIAVLVCPKKPSRYPDTSTFRWSFTNLGVHCDPKREE